MNLPLAVTVISWAFNFAALKLLYREVPPPAVALIRFAGMYLLLMGICKVQNLSLRFERRDAFSIMLLGFISMGIYMVLFLEGMNKTSAGEGAIILATGPILTGVMAAAFKQERFSSGAMVGAVVGFAGVVLVVVDGAKTSTGHVFGDVAIFFGAILWSYSAVLMKPLLSRYQPVQLLTMSMPGAFIAVLPYGLRATIDLHSHPVGIISWALIFHLAAISGALGFAGFYAGVRAIGAAGAMLYQYFVPPLAVAFAWWLLGTPMTLMQFAGLVVVIAGVATSMHFRQRAQRQLEPA